MHERPSPRPSCAGRSSRRSSTRFRTRSQRWRLGRTSRLRASHARSDRRQSFVVLCYSGAVYIDEAGRPLRIRRTPDPAELASGILRTNLIGGPSTVLVRADALRQTGEFDEKLNVLADWDMWIRMLERGPAIVCNEILAGYRVHATNMHSREVSRIRSEPAYLRRKHRARSRQ